MEGDHNWIKDYLPLATAVVALAVALFQYIVGRPKLKLEIAKLQKELSGVTENTQTNSESISEIRKDIAERLYPDEQIVYQNTSGNVGFDFRGNQGKIYDGSRAISGEGRGNLSFIDPGIINIDRENIDGRFELYLRSYTVGAQKREIIPKNPADDKPKKFRVSCETRAINGEHTIRFVLRDRDNQKWIGKSVTYRITSPEWKVVDAYFTLPPLIEAELRIDDEDVSKVPSTLQIRKLLMTQQKTD